MKNNIPEYLLKTPHSGLESRKGAQLSFTDKTILNTAKAVKLIYLQAENSDRSNLICRINPSIKLICLVYFAVIISLANNISSQSVIFLFIVFLFFAAKLSILEIFRKILFLVFIFGFIVVLPASLNVITPGNIIFNVLRFSHPLHFWIYDIPQNIGITDKGTEVVLLVFLRVLNSISFAFFIVFTTPFPSFIKSFKILGIPDTFLMIITLAYKYFFILARTIEETYFALKSRLYGNLRSSNLRKLASGRIFFIYRRSHIIYEGTYNAMVSRGYSGKIMLAANHHFTYTDVIFLFIIVAFGITVILI